MSGRARPIEKGADGCERFTDRARRVPVLANEEGRLLGHTYLGAEHIRLGLRRGHDGIAAQALTAVGVGLDEARAKVDTSIGSTGRGSSGSTPFTPLTRPPDPVVLIPSESARRPARSYRGCIAGSVRHAGGRPSRFIGVFEGPTVLLLLQIGAVAQWLK